MTLCVDKYSTRLHDQNIPWEEFQILAEKILCCSSLNSIMKCSKARNRERIWGSNDYISVPEIILMFIFTTVIIIGWR
jgi:hypothetical protein